MQAPNYFAIYSTFCGSSKNRTFNAAPVTSDYPHLFISNNQEVLSDAARMGWTPLFLEAQVSDDPVVSAHQAKIAKSIPHIISQVDDFRFTLYKDDKITLDVDKIAQFIPEFEERNSPLAVRRHPFLSRNILFEFGEAMLQPRYKSQMAQTVDYIGQELSDGFKLESQLYATGVILRNMRHPETRELNEMWFAHIQRCGIECQISFDFVAQRYPSISLLEV